jgi:hypothetical protein
VLLFQSLLAHFIRLLAGLPLVLLILLLLQLLPFLILLRNQLGVLLLQLLVARHIPGVRRGILLSGRQILGMYDWTRFRVLRPSVLRPSVLRSSIFRTGT